MYSYILCYCGRSLGDVADLFDRLRQEKYKKLYNVEVNAEFIHAMATQVELNDIFELLHIYLPCCRLRLMTQVKIQDLS
jgi:DNA-directed RNA polymerase subunit N (RpoN/RPB10)